MAIEPTPFIRRLGALWTLREGARGKGGAGSCKAVGAFGTPAGRQDGFCGRTCFGLLPSQLPFPFLLFFLPRFPASWILRSAPFHVPNMGRFMTTMNWIRASVASSSQLARAKDSITPLQEGQQDHVMANGDHSLSRPEFAD